MRSLLTLLLLALGTQAVAACGEGRWGLETSVAAPADRTWELCLLTLERDFAPVSFEHSETRGSKVTIGGGPLSVGVGTRELRDPKWESADHKAIVHRPWPDGSNPPGDRIEVSVTSQEDCTRLRVTSNHPRNNAAVMRAIFGTLEENGVEFVKIGFGSVGGD